MKNRPSRRRPLGRRVSTCAFVFGVLSLAAAAPGAAHATSVGCAVLALEAEAGGVKSGSAAAALLASAVNAAPAAPSEGGGCAAAVQIADLVFTPSAENPQSGVLAFTTDAPATPRVTVRDPEGDWVVPPSGVLSDAPGTEHRVMVLGLRAETPYAFEAGVEGASAAATVSYTPPALPADFPPIEAAVSDAERLSPGATFFSLTRDAGAVADLAWAYLMAVDSAGRVVWSHKAGPEANDFRRLANGRIAYLAFDPLEKTSAAVEIDMLGRETGRWTAEGLEAANPGRTVDNFHHHLEELPNGNFLTLSTEMRAVAGYGPEVPNCPGGACNVVGDKIVEFTREGEIVGEWSLFDVLDPRRTMDDFDLRFWDGLYGKITKDWTHANAAVYDPRDDTMIVSCRNQDVVVKMTRTEPARLVWVLGTPSEESEADDAWPFLRPDFARSIPGGYAPSRQHAPELLADGSLLLYDNGNGRDFTSLVRFGLDEAAGSARFAWKWIDPDYAPALFSPFVGDVDALPNGNYLQADGALALDPLDGASRSWSRVVEIDPASGEKLLELKVRDGRASGATGYQIYRAERMGLYPPAP